MPRVSKRMSRSSELIGGIRESARSWGGTGIDPEAPFGMYPRMRKPVLSQSLPPVLIDRCVSLIYSPKKGGWSSSLGAGLLDVFSSAHRMAKFWDSASLLVGTVIGLRLGRPMKMWPVGAQPPK
jgi:hypothetical protein